MTILESKIQYVEAGKAYKSETLGQFYKLIKKMGETTRDKVNILEGFFDRLMEGGWFTTQYSDDQFSVKIQEWTNGLAIDPYLDNMTVEYYGKVVYESDVHRDAVDLHRIKLFNRDKNWQTAVNEFVQKYAI